MKLELKAYKCAFPELYTDCYDSEIWVDPKQYEIIYGDSQKDAVKSKCYSMTDSYTYWEIKQYIRTRRFKEGDLYSQKISEYLEKLSEKEIKHLTHSLGVTIGGYCPKEFYRNYSQYTEKHERCEKLVSLGLMKNWQKLGSEVYSVTDKGITAVRTLLLNVKND